ncbi:MAG: magnesium/cobalt transporter CorA [Candidatus Omnitrophica bacterium]|nr:magnesium/cobalt transporter CorA [Candidatus Omnitrophota bacterium]
MSKLIKRVSRMAGAAPGTLIHIGKERHEEVRITLIRYDEASSGTEAIKDPADLIPEDANGKVSWINVNGVHDVSVVEKIGEVFGIHPLVLEDILNTSQRPKTEEFEGYMFTVLKMIYYDPGSEQTIIEQVSLILGKNYVISFQEQEGDVFDPLRKRIRDGVGRVRKKGPDYLAYCLMDSVVDNYFSVLEKFAEDLEVIEEELASSPGEKTLMKIHKLKRDAVLIRKAVWPLREIISVFQKEGAVLIETKNNVFFRDVYDHTIQVIDTVEALRDMVSGLLDIYLSSVSNKMNEVMKVLTVFASIFIPLTFIAGIYGMNFKYMPELEWHWGYFGVLGFMAAVGISMLIFFKRRNWL